MRNKIIIIFLILILTFQIVVAINMPSRNLGIMPVDFVVPKPALVKENTPQRIVYIEPELENIGETPLQGD